MIVLFYAILFIIGLCHCNDNLPSKTEVESSINRTIDEVERLIRQNSTLPHLSRHEIIDILFNITSKDLETHQNNKTIEEARNIYQKALMVVLPYNAEDKENIKDLYTKPPIVQLITDSSSNPEDFEAWENKKQMSTLVQKMQHDKQSRISQTKYKNHRETYSEAISKMPLKETLKFESTPVKFSFNLENLQKQPIFTEEQAITSRQPVFQRSSIKDKEVYTVYSTSATTNPPDTVESKMKTFRPLKYNENVLSVDQWRYNAPTTPNTTMLTKLPDIPFKKIRDKSIFPTTYMPLEKMTPANKINYISESSTTEKMQIVNTEQSAPIFYVTPIPFSSSLSPSSSFAPREKLKYNFTYNLNSGGFRRITTTTTMRPKVMELLASIGLRPENTTNVEDVFKKNDENLKMKSQIPNSNGLVHTTFDPKAVASTNSPSINAQDTFKNPVSEIRKGMNNLTPDVQLLFQRFGLQTSNLATTTMSTLKLTSNTNSYTNFKPLPISKIENEDMKEFLAKFGLGINDNRQRKAMSVSTERPSLIEAVPHNMRRILENIGLISRKTAETTIKMDSVEPTKTTKFHVFKPHEVHVKNEGQRIKINELLDKIKLVQEGKANAKDVRKVADNLLATTKTLKDGPDPLSLEEMIRIYDIDVKNEVKRQQNLEETTINDDQTVANITTPVESVDVSSTTTTVIPLLDSTNNGSNFRDASTVQESSTPANLAALEESFGGTTRSPDPALPTKRRNGLYFLADWNTFLEVGEGSEKVNLRFEPKVGDGTRFLPVSVP